MDIVEYVRTAVDQSDRRNLELILLAAILEQLRAIRLALQPVVVAEPELRPEEETLKS